LISPADANAQADAYAQKLANEGTCFIPSVYARLEIVPLWSEDLTDGEWIFFNQYVSVWVKFYSDPECTQPKILPNNVEFSVRDDFWEENPYMSAPVLVSGYSIQGTALAGTDGYEVIPEVSLYGIDAWRDENGDYINFDAWVDLFTLEPKGTNYGIGPAIGNGIPPNWLP
jgi:hypothetical protein